MARVRVTAAVHLRCSAVAIRIYPAGYVGPAPDDHIERIVAAGKGIRLSRLGETFGQPKVRHDDGQHPGNVAGDSAPERDRRPAQG